MVVGRWVLAVTVLVALFQGCGGQSEGAGGSAGMVASGARGGSTQAGASGAAPGNSTGGAADQGEAGTATGGGSGQRTTRGGEGGESARGAHTGGSGDRGGSAGSGAASGDAGAGAGGTRTLETDPDWECSCTSSSPGEFDCVVPLDGVPDAFRKNPENCPVREATVKKSACEGGTHYELDTGGAHYELEWWVNLKYYHAAGTMTPPCGLDPHEFTHGTVTAGGHQTRACDEGCMFCGEADAVPLCGPCVLLPGSGAAVVSLADYCAVEPCPATPEEAVALMAKSCGDDGHLVVGGPGCGYITVEPFNGMDEWYPPNDAAYYFDATSRALVGVLLSDPDRDPESASVGGCSGHRFAAGDVSAQYCADPGEWCQTCWPGRPEFELDCL